MRLRVVRAFNTHSTIASLFAIAERPRLEHANGWASTREERGNGLLQIFLVLEIASRVHGGDFLPLMGLFGLCHNMPSI